MRTIKFKGKEKTGEWRYGDYIAPDYTDFGTYIRGREMVHGDGFSAEGLYEVIPETVGQFTGLKDKNGKEIYEGDVVRWTHDFCCGEFTEKVEHQKVNGVIVWAEQVGKFMMKDTDNNHWDFKRIQTNQCFEIIGNIHTEN